uniref:Vesicle transport protein n=1 Tax=Populus davidiana TaxID=266767 RepID=A0A6M2EGQ0_9ROSI
MWKLNQFLSGDDEEREESFLEEESDDLCSLSPTQRMYAFAASLVAGLALMFLSLIVFAKPIKFALLFTFGNVLAVGRLFGTPSWTMPALLSRVLLCIWNTAFLIGPGRQIGMMFDPARIYATAIYIGCVVLALICALLIHSKILTVFAIIFEICALIWYSLSYIPFARRMVSNLMIRLCDTEL